MQLAVQHAAKGGFGKDRGPAKAAHDPRRRSPLPTICVLESTSILRKYIGVLDIFLSAAAAVSRPEKHLCVWAEPVLNYRAMNAHYSQFVWYRKLFVVFSRYTYMNTVDVVVDRRHAQRECASW